MAALRAGNLALKFALEIAAVLAFAYGGATAGSGVVAVVLAVAAPLVAVILWGRFAAPGPPDGSHSACEHPSSWPGSPWLRSQP